MIRPRLVEGADGDLGNRIPRFCGAVEAGAGAGHVEIGVIEDVESVGLELEIEALVDAAVLLEGEIEARLKRPAEGIAAVAGETGRVGVADHRAAHRGTGRDTAVWRGQAMREQSFRSCA